MAHLNTPNEPPTTIEIQRERARLKAIWEGSGGNAAALARLKWLDDYLRRANGTDVEPPNTGDKKHG